MPAAGSSNSTSASLLERVKEFDPEAWDRLTRLYAPVVYRWCRQAGVQDSDASDVSQETFRAVATAVGDFRRDRAGDSFRGWLWTITRNKLRDHFRRCAAGPGAVGGSVAAQRLMDIPDRPFEEADHDSRADTTAGIARRALAVIECEFEQRTWQAFFRIVVGGQTAAMVADDLGMSAGAVYTAKSRVLRRLREEIEDLL